MCLYTPPNTLTAVCHTSLIPFSHAFPWRNDRAVLSALVGKEEQQYWEHGWHTQGRGHISAFSMSVWLKGAFLLFRIGCCVDNIHPDTSELATQVLFVATNKKRLWRRSRLRYPRCSGKRPRGKTKALGNPTGLFRDFVDLDVSSKLDTVQENAGRRYSAIK